MARESVCIDVEGDKKDKPRTVLVVGAGIAGLETARRAAFSGHKTILCDKADAIGGQIRYAGMVPGRAEIADMLPWYQTQIAKHGVDMRLGVEVDAALLEAVQPDVVVVATGSASVVPENMLDLVCEAGDINLAVADDVFEGDLTGENILVVGGDQIGMQIADYLSEGGRRVVVAEPDHHFAQKMAANDRWYLIARTVAKGVQRFKDVHDIKVSPAGVVLETAKGEQVLEGIDTIVFASERKSVRSVAELARAKGIETHIVGDAADATSVDGGTIFANIAQAYDLARSL